jgi:pimeloyl-ACP methyl ester carboxylesterase
MTGGESWFLRKRLAADFGLRTHVFHYPTVSSAMADVTAALHAFVQKLAPPRLHLVGHSLGGLVIYRYFERYRGTPPGRVVFLGTPAVASRAAAAAGHSQRLARIMGRCACEELLRHHERRWEADRELGVIAGTRRLGMGQFLAHFHEDCDGTIAVSETRLPGAADHLTLPVSHMGMLLSARVAQETGCFLRDGHFSLR